MHSGDTSKTDARTTGVGEITVLLASSRLHLEAANLSPPRSSPTPMTGASGGVPLVDKGMPTAVRSICLEHVEVFILAELDRTASAATRYRSPQPLQQVGRRGRDRSVTHDQDAAAQDPGKSVPMLSDDYVRLLLAACAGRISAATETARSSDSSWTPACASKACAACGTTQTILSFPKWTSVARSAHHRERAAVNWACPSAPRPPATSTGTSARGGGTSAYARLRADARTRRETRQTVRRALIVTAPRQCERASLHGCPRPRAPRLRMLAKVPVQRRAAHSGEGYQHADFGALLGSHDSANHCASSAVAVSCGSRQAAAWHMPGGPVVREINDYRGRIGPPADRTLGHVV